MYARKSLFACYFFVAILLIYRFYHSDYFGNKPVQLSTWDAFGYYLYLPGIFIYQDIKELNWIPAIDKKYSLTGGTLYQTSKLANGNQVGKYLGGVAILQLPFFLFGHFIAHFTNYPRDGFSAPYQNSIALGAIFYCTMTLFGLRKLLLKYFSDMATFWSLSILVLATNLIHYVATYAAGMSHVFILPLYVAIIYATIKWHDRPSLFWAAIIGFIIGLASICRPTEVIMLFIPLLWNTHTRESSRIKWGMVKMYKRHIIGLLGFTAIGILPQLIYWKYVTGNFIHDVGSKWVFLNPFFRVLFGFENGWFIYTPATLLFVIGLLFIKRFPFRYSFISFCLLNIWIVISWFDWRYGASYSTRALIQSYPVFAFPLTAVIQSILSTKWRYAFYFIAIYLIFVNQFQLYQYDKGILHFRDMNKAYYKRIYLNPNPSPVDLSFLDHNEAPSKEDHFYNIKLLGETFYNEFFCTKDTSFKLMYLNPLDSFNSVRPKESWIKIEARLKSTQGYQAGHFNCRLEYKNKIINKRLRFALPGLTENQFNDYIFYVKMDPASEQKYKIKLYLSSEDTTVGELSYLRLYRLMH